MEENVKKKKTILVVEDEPAIREVLVFNIKKEGYNTLEAGDGITGLNIAIELRPDLILLDIMLPKLDGLSVCKNIKNVYNVPILMLTAKNEEREKIVGLEIGADDYITKPFNPLEVTARVKSQLRRYLHLGSKITNDNKIIIDGIELDDDKKSVTLEGEEVALTPLEYDILKLIMQNPNKVYSPKEIYSNIWKETLTGNENSVAVHIRHLREKIEIDPSNPRYIKVVWGKGYMFSK